MQGMVGMFSLSLDIAILVVFMGTRPLRAGLMEYLEGLMMK